MQFEFTGFEGLFLIIPERIQDDRGSFFRTFCKREFEAQDLHFDFVQSNHSSNTHRGTLRGMHAQAAPYTEDKLVRCVRGAVWDVAVDLRYNSATYLNYFGVQLSEENQLSLWIPKGFAHGFLTLADHTDLLYLHTQFYTPGYECCLRFDDPQLNIDWPETVRKISDKDLSYPFIDSNFKGL